MNTSPAGEDYAVHDTSLGGVQQERAADGSIDQLLEQETGT